MRASYEFTKDELFVLFAGCELASRDKKLTGKMRRIAINLTTLFGASESQYHDVQTAVED